MANERTIQLEGEKIHGKQVEIHIDYAGRAEFQVTLEEGNTLKNTVLETLRENVNKWYDRQKTKKRKKLNIPFLLWTDDADYIKDGVRRKHSFGRKDRVYPHQFLNCVVTSIHAANGNPIMKIGAGPAKQNTWLRGTLFPVLTDEQKEEYQRLHDAKKEADAAMERFEEHHSIGSNDSALKSWMKERGAEE
jgi:hypothetical protein